MFVIVHNNFVVWGPKSWNKLGFEDVLRTDCEVEYNLPQTNDNRDPIIIGDTVKILPVVGIDNPAMNTKIHRLEGPYWNFYDTYAESYFVVTELPLFQVKDTLKGIVATNRYVKEISGFTTEVQGESVKIDTSREGRSIYFDTYLAMGDTDLVGWKFDKGFKSISKAELGAIVMAGKAHIQSCFAWEAAKIDEIDAATTLEELDAIVLEP